MVINIFSYSLHTSLLNLILFCASEEYNAGEVNALKVVRMFTSVVRSACDVFWISLVYHLAGI